MLSLEFIEKMSKFSFSSLVGFDYHHTRTRMSRPSCTWQFDVFLQAQVYQEMLRFSCTLRRAHVPKLELDVIPILWVTKEIMSRGPQAADMESRETTWPTIPFAQMKNSLTTPYSHSFADGIHHTIWLLEGSGPCSMRYTSTLCWASF